MGAGLSAPDGMPNMNCPGSQQLWIPVYYTLLGRPTYSPGTPLPNNSQYKCYDGMQTGTSCNRLLMTACIVPERYVSQSMSPDCLPVRIARFVLAIRPATVANAAGGKYVVEMVVPRATNW